MGLTRFRGPVYGAKALLWNYGPYTMTSSGGTTALFTPNSLRVLPNYEDWYITEVNLTCSTNSSANNALQFIVKSKGGSTTGIASREDGKPSTVTQTIATFLYSTATAQNSTTWSTFATVTASPGEFEGLYVPAGSTIRIVSSGVDRPSGMQFNVMGYIRYVSSTRAEGI